MRTLPPAGTHIPPGVLARYLWRGSRRDGEAPLVQAVREYLGSERVFCLSQGRAALTLSLQALAARSPRRSVIVPAYTCYTVPASVVKAGLRVLPVDILPSTLDYDRQRLEEVDPSDVLAVLSSSLYGIPGDLAYLESYARSRGMALIDDAAQAFGATRGGRYAGTFGSAGFFSLGRGKSLTTLEGAILVTRDPDFAADVERRIAALPEEGRFDSSRDRVLLTAASLFLNPALYGLPSRLLSLGETRFDPGFPIRRYNAAMSRLAAYLVRHIDAINAARRAKAARLRERLTEDGRVSLVEEAPGAHAIYIRFPVRVTDAERRATIARELKRRGLGVTMSYPKAVPDIPGIGPYLAGAPSCPGGAEVASTILTLPTHALVRDEDLERIADTIQGCG